MGTHSGYKVVSVVPDRNSSMNAESMVRLPIDKDVPDDSFPVFQPTMPYPVLENVGDGSDTVDPMVMLFKGGGAVPWVLSVLNRIEYLTAVHFGYNVAFPPDEKQESIMSSVIANCPDPMSMPVPSEEVFQTVAVYPVFLMFTVGIAAPEMTVSDDNAPGASPVPPFAS